MLTGCRYVRQEDLSEDSSGLREYIRHWRITTDSRVAVRQQILDARPDFRRWQPHPDDPECRLQRMQIRQERHALIYWAELLYSNQTGLADNPLARPTQWELRSAVFPYAATHDADNRPYVNTAGSPLEGVTRYYPGVVAIGTKNVPAVPPGLANYAHAVNSDSIIIKGQPMGPRTARLDDWSLGVENIENEVKYLPLSLVIAFNPLTWDEVRLNRGLEELAVIATPIESGGGGTTYTNPRYIKQAMTEGGDYLREPAFLDADGRRHRVKLDSAGNPVGPSVLQDVFNAYQSGGGLKYQEAVKVPLQTQDIITLQFKDFVALPFGQLPLQ